MQEFTSDWSVNRFIIVVHEKFFNRVLDKKTLSELLKKIVQTTIIKLFEDQSEVSALPAGCVIFGDS